MNMTIKGFIQSGSLVIVNDDKGHLTLTVSMRGRQQGFIWPNVKVIPRAQLEVLAEEWFDFDWSEANYRREG